MTADRHLINICFHGVGEPGRDLEPGEDRYWVDRDAFLAILDEVAAWPATRISFDDGNLSDLSIGLPALVDRDLTADFFVLAGRLGEPGSLDAAGVRELRRHGMTIGTHGMSHRSWRAMDPATVRDELVVARERLAAAAGSPVDLAACPLGRYDRRLLASLRRLDYARVFTSDRRPARPGAWLQPRFSVRRGDTPASLRAEVLARPSRYRRARLAAVGIAKRLR
ncbi:polysaccharide deacetylase family protein [Micromonospora costi]|uniref:polysaccharide deacetylase family protein n=1 Tax=Micromonospora costi TaxID=1530042 RepID=UPI0033D287DE